MCAKAPGGLSARSHAAAVTLAGSSDGDEGTSTKPAPLKSNPCPNNPGTKPTGSVLERVPLLSPSTSAAVPSACHQLANPTGGAAACCTRPLGAKVMTVFTGTINPLSEVGR